MCAIFKSITGSNENKIAHGLWRRAIQRNPQAISAITKSLLFEQSVF